MPSRSPWPPPGEKVVTGFNRRVDVLENERAHRRIDERHYALGRIV